MVDSGERHSSQKLRSNKDKKGNNFLLSLNVNCRNSQLTIQYVSLALTLGVALTRMVDSGERHNQIVLGVDLSVEACMVEKYIP